MAILSSLSLNAQEIRSITSIQQDALKGDPNSQYYLGIHYKNNDDTTSALVWLKKAAIQGHVESVMSVGEHYYKSNQYNEAQKWFRVAVELDNIEASYYLANSLFFGDDPNNETIEWFNFAAKAGHIKAKSDLAFLYYIGLKVESNINIAIQLYKEAAELGDYDAMSWLGKIYGDDESGVLDYNEAYKWSKMAYDAGEISSSTTLALLYLFGNGVKQNFSEAFKYMKVSADSGNMDLAFLVGRAYETGQGVEKDFCKAFHYYSVAANADDYWNSSSHAALHLANCYANGIGVGVDYGKAFEWYNLSAKRGLAEGYYCLGECYADGNGVEQSYSKAIECYRIAADNGFSKAQYILGEIYYAGNITERSLETSYQLFSYCQEIFPKAREYMTQIENVLKSTLIRENKKIAIIISNGEYQNEPSIPYSEHNTNLLSGIFKTRGFDVIVINDADKQDLAIQLNDISKIITEQNYNISILYYCGHGIEDNGSCYIVPTDVDFRYDFEPDISSCYLFSNAVAQLKNRNGVVYAIFDACRSSNNNLSWSQPGRINQNTCMIYSTSSGSTISGDKMHTYYAMYLSKEMESPGNNMQDILNNVNWLVEQATGGSQSPFMVQGSFSPEYRSLRID